MTDRTEQAAVASRVRYGETAVPDNPTILVPIRYPLTDSSTRTLERASQIADEYGAKELLVLHVNVLQHTRSATAEEIYGTVRSLSPDQPISVHVCRSFLVEEAILSEAESIQADVIVLGKNQRSAWRRGLNRLVGNGLNISSYLCDRTDVKIIVVE